MIYHKATDVNVHQVTMESIVKKRDLIVATILVLQGLCAKMNQVTITTHASADLVILDKIVM